MKNKIVLIPFPFDNFSEIKIRPALCLTNKVGKYDHVVVAFITSQVTTGLSKTDILIDKSKSYFNKTGLKVSSAIRLHRIVTIPESLIQRELGKLPLDLDTLVKNKLKELFDL